MLRHKVMKSQALSALILNTAFYLIVIKVLITLKLFLFPKLAWNASILAILAILRHSQKSQTHHSVELV